MNYRGARELGSNLGKIWWCGFDWEVAVEKESWTWIKVKFLTLLKQQAMLWTGRWWQWRNKNPRMTPEFWFRKPSSIFYWYFINPKHSKADERIEAHKRICDLLKVHTAKIWSMLATSPVHLSPDPKLCDVASHSQVCFREEAWVKAHVCCWGETTEQSFQIWPFNNWSRALHLPKIRLESTSVCQRK